MEWRKGRIVVWWEMTKSMLKAKCLKEFLHTTAYILNRRPTSTLCNQTPLEAWHGRKPKVTHFEVFRCVAYVLVPSQKREKLDDNTVKCIFVGYSAETKGYRFYDPTSKKLLINRDVVFDEKSTWDLNKV